MQSIELGGLDGLLGSVEGTLRRIPELKREMLEGLAKETLDVVARRIGGSGKVRQWQGYYVGTRLGYVAVRPKADTYYSTKGGTRYPVGYLTNAIENGHAIRRASATRRDGYRYRPRIKTARVDGLHFYYNAADEAAAKGRAVLEGFAARAAAELSGG